MDIQPGKRYFDKDGNPRLVRIADDETVTCYDLFGRDEVEYPRADFEAWAATGTRRNYLHANGERRIRFRFTDADLKTGRGPGVVWVSVDAQTDEQWSKLSEWQAWRKDAV